MASGASFSLTSKDTFNAFETVSCEDEIVSDWVTLLCTIALSAISSGTMAAGPNASLAVSEPSRPKGGHNCKGSGAWGETSLDWTIDDPTKASFVSTALLATLVPNWLFKVSIPLQAGQDQFFSCSPSTEFGTCMQAPWNHLLQPSQESIKFPSDGPPQVQWRVPLSSIAIRRARSSGIIKGSSWIPHWSSFNKETLIDFVSPFFWARDLRIFDCHWQVRLSMNFMVRTAFSSGSLNLDTSNTKYWICEM